ncbi:MULTISPECIES: AAA family ATPase [Methylomonas]|uniref:AAA family ATPase n=1 Tax=Methylomonas TaxID=416 RepID=UPI0007C98BAD|nr:MULTISPECIES: AAA family ATPase [Methylomonas]ANE54351.1 chromosome segregation protein SMC [Methylomonas sp. DH-1]WNB76679.1 AAA family ATPase [Methylomonas koyamae]
MFLEKIRLKNLLSFQDETIDLKPLNILIGHNGSGKSNLIEAIGLLQSTPRGIAGSIREGGGVVDDWIWKGANKGEASSIEAVVCRSAASRNRYAEMNLRYKLDFASINRRFEIIDERIENENPLPGHDNPRFYFFYQNGFPMINAGDPDNPGNKRRLKREDIDPEKSILAQRRDPENYPELTWLGDRFSRIKIYREWSFGRDTHPRKYQSTALETDFLREDCLNLGLILNNLHNQPTPKERILEALRALYPTITDFGVNIEGAAAQVFLHEGRFSIPATRLSDGTLRFMCLLAILCHPTPPPLICIEEPELGLHPDALAELAKLLREASERTQLVVTTHSDLLVDEFTNTPDEVVTFEKDGETTSMQRLNSNQLDDWLQKYTLGQMRQSGHIGGNRW